jgi:hypothetical protein
MGEYAITMAYHDYRNEKAWCEFMARVRNADEWHQNGTTAMSSALIETSICMVNGIPAVADVMRGGRFVLLDFGSQAPRRLTMLQKIMLRVKHLARLKLRR